MEMNAKLDVFSDMLSLVKGDSEERLAPSRFFYMEKAAKRAHKTFGKQMEAMVEEELELKKTEQGKTGNEFNNWILA